MSQIAKIVGWILGVISFLLVIVVVFIATFNWNRLKPTINHKVSTELNRTFAIKGALGIDWVRHSKKTGWRSWIPWPQIHAEDIILGNPPAIPQVKMACLPRVDTTLSLLALLHKQIYLPWIKLKHPDINLIQTADKHNNWTFNFANSNKKAARTSSWAFRLDNLIFDRSDITWRDAINKANITFKIDPLGKLVP